MRFAMILLLVFISSMLLVNAQQIYRLQPNISKNDQVTLNSIKTDYGEEDIVSSSMGEPYKILILSMKGETLYFNDFKINFITHIDTEQGAIYQNISYRTFYWNLPYFENAKQIQLYHENKLIWSYNIEYLSKQSTDVPEQKPQGKNNAMFLIASAGIVLLIIIIIFVYRKLLKKS